MRRLTTALLATGLLLTLAGCGSPSKGDAGEFPDTSGPFGSLSPDEIVNQAITATAKVKTLRFQTTGDAKNHLVFDLRRAANGTCFGQITVRAGTISAILTADHTYYRGSAEFWRKLKFPDLSAEMARTPWIWARVPSNRTYRGFCDVKQLPSSVGVFPNLFSRLQVGAVHYGNDNRTVVDLTGDDSAWSVTVDANKPHYLLELRCFDTVAELSEFGEPASVTLPTEGEYVAFDSDVLAS
jgi:hypothetical protein